MTCSLQPRKATMQRRALSGYKPECRCEARSCKLCSLKRAQRDLRLQLRDTSRAMVQARGRQRRQGVPYGLTNNQRRQVLCTFVLSGNNGIVALQHGRILRARNKPSSSPLPTLGFVRQLYRDASEAVLHRCLEPQTSAEKQLHVQSRLFLAEAKLFRWVRRQNFECHSAPTTAAALAMYRASLGDIVGCRSGKARGGRKWLQRWGRRWDVRRGAMPFRIDVEAAQLPQKVGQYL